MSANHELFKSELRDKGDIYLFLCDCDGDKWKNLENFKTWELVEHRIFNDGVGDWILFMLKLKS